MNKNHGMYKHGMSDTKIFSIWMHMHKRCRDRYEYTRNGIKVCDRWKEFKNFYEDMGDVPEGMTLERVNNNENYSPENCRWATRKEQARNRRNTKIIEYNGETRTIPEWAEVLGIDYNTLRQRLYNGWSVKRAFTQRVRVHEYW